VVQRRVEKDPSYVVDDDEDESGGGESEDEEECNDQSYTPSAEHDPNDPPMKEGPHLCKHVHFQSGTFSACNQTPFWIQ
jgi:hypothetical protein